MLLNRLVPTITEDHLPETLSGFKANMVFILTKTLEQLSRDHLVTDDATIVAHTKRDLQHLNSCFAEATQLFGLEVSLKKTGPSPACTPRRVPPSPHHHRWNWAESSSSVHLSEVYHHIRCQDQRCPWCSRYRRRKWTRRHEFKSWTRLIAFHIALIPLGKVWIQLFSLQLWVNSRTD